MLVWLASDLHPVQSNGWEIFHKWLPWCKSSNLEHTWSATGGLDRSSWNGHCCLLHSWWPGLALLPFGFCSTRFSMEALYPEFVCYRHCWLQRQTNTVKGSRLSAETSFQFFLYQNHKSSLKFTQLISDFSSHILCCLIDKFMSIQASINVTWFCSWRFGTSCVLCNSRVPWSVHIKEVVGCITRRVCIAVIHYFFKTDIFNTCSCSCTMIEFGITTMDLPFLPIYSSVYGFWTI